MLDRSGTGERALIVHIKVRQEDPAEALAEFRELAEAAGVAVVAIVEGAGDVPHPRYFVGTGKATEIREAVQRTQVDVVLFSHPLTPAQERNLERLLQCRVLDRTEVILDIFAQRARTFEGKLQVELAQLRYLSTRLVRGWTHLERQKGGIGLRGPGETQLETDRRLIGKRMKQIRSRLEKVRRQRAQGRRARRRAVLVSVALVGYTNAGKSTLFNRLSGAAVFTADQLFATLDPTLRRIDIDGAGSAVIGDTVGFIRDLPHDLVVAFRATLEEAGEAELLLHVIDACAEQRREQIDQVDQVLQAIGAAQLPRIEVYNKIDRLAACKPRIERDSVGHIQRVWLSAATGEGVELLKQAIAERRRGRKIYRWLRVPSMAGRIRARLYDVGAVLDETVDDDGSWLLEVALQRPFLEYLSRQEGIVVYPHWNGDHSRTRVHGGNACG